MKSLPYLVVDVEIAHRLVKVHFFHMLRGRMSIVRSTISHTKIGQGRIRTQRTIHAQSCREYLFLVSRGCRCASELCIERGGG